jgi:hypothetical protein
MEDINIGIFVVLMLAIAFYHHPQQTIRILMLPLVGLFVVIEILLSIVLTIFGKIK